MINSKIQLFIFGDQTENPIQQLLDLLRDAKESKLLADFFKLCSYALVSQIMALNSIERDQFPKFDSIDELVEVHCQQNSYDDVITGVLLCLTQFGCFIRYMESTSQMYPCSDTIYLGLCTGLLSAAAMASSKSLTHLLTIATDIVCVCFRVGLEAKRRAQQLEPENHNKNSWSIAILNICPREVQSLIKTIQKELNIVPNKQAYVSAELGSSVTISGPPSTLEVLVSKKKSFANFQHIPIPIRAAYHAGHLGSVDIESIMGSQSPFRTYSVNAQIYSTRHGKCYGASNLQDLLVNVIEDILMEPLKWNHVITEVIAQITSIKCAEIDILSFGSTKASKYLVDSLREAGITVNIRNITEVRSVISRYHRSGDIAIVGMGGRFPEGEDLEKFWNTLMDGLDVHKEIPSDRFDVKSHCDPTGAIQNSTLTPYGCFLDQPGLVDASLFNMSPREAAQTDPQQRLALMTTYEALEMAGYVPNRTPSTNNRKIGTFFGQTSDDWREINASQNIDIYFITGGNRAFGPARLNYYFKWEGPSYSIDTACSSSAAAVQLAYTALMSGECDTAIAGGMNILTSPNEFAGLSRASFLSMTGSCKTFDDEADGYCRSDAVGCIVMKRLEDAIADNDNVLGVVKGAVTNHSAEAVSITQPHVKTQQRLYHMLLNNANLHPNDIDYIEMHGTGTQAGDASEMRSVIDVFSQNRSPEMPLFVGSVKPNVGHAEAASGITSIIKAIMMLQNNMIPPHVGIKNRINSKFPPLDKLNVHIVKCATQFKPRTNNSKRRIVINNFNAAGGNTAILIEDAPVRAVQGFDPRTVHVVTVSAKTSFSFKENGKRLLAYITKHEELSLGDISYTTTARRIHHVFRTAYAVSSIVELKSSLEKFVASTIAPIKTSSMNVALLFTGQNSHYLAMGKDLFDNCSTFRRNILKYDNICQTQDLPSFKALIDGSAQSLETLSTVQVQLALVALELALANLWFDFGIKPAVVIGHSLGEYAALCIAGVISVNDALFLVGKRANLMLSACTQGTHAMLAVMLDATNIKKDLSESNTSCEIACCNSPQSTIISGRISEIASLKIFYESKGIVAKQLDMPFAFHSSQLDPILKDFRTAAESVSFFKPVIPVASTLFGSIVQQEGIFTAEYLCRHAREPVKFIDALEECKATGTINDRTLWLEIGPKPVCSNMVKSTLNVSEPFILQTLKKGESSLATIANCIAKVYALGIDINWMAYQREYESSHRLLALPTYAFDMQNYWIQYEGDWCLRKNVVSYSQSIQKQTGNFFGTTSLQRIQHENFNSSGVNVVFISDISEPKLRNIIQGHVVNKVAICPASVYSDMAFTAAKYIYNRCNQSSSTISMDIINMKIVQPLIQKRDFGKQLIYVIATHKIDSDLVELKFTSDQDSTTKYYATCTVQYGNSVDWMDEWNRHAYLIQSRIDHLIEAAKYGKSHRLLRGIVYKLFSIFVQYSEKYRGITEVWMDSNMLEATAKIKLQATDEDGIFECNPYWLDSISHLSGFILHGADTMHDDFVYIAHGWKSMRIGGNLFADKSYKNYVRMQSTDNGHRMIGDVYIFEEDKVIAVLSGLEFQRIRRSTLEYILPSTVDKVVIDGVQAAFDDRKFSSSDVNSSLITDSNAFLFDKILEVIASETGVERAQLHDETNLVDFGIDSLLTISIIARLRQLTNLDVPVSLFNTYSTIGDLRKIVTIDQFSNDKVPDTPDKTSISEHSSSSMTSNSISAVSSCPSVDSMTRIIRSETGIDISEAVFQNQYTFSEVIDGLTPRNKSTSILLQGTSTSLSKLFLFPDGSGSASSYSTLPTFNNGMVVYGLNSPFLHCSSEFTCTMEEIAAIYLIEIRKRQPFGPYILGGWSSGGILAYEAATQLIRSGETVLGLIFIDSPCPLTLPPLPFESVDFFDSIHFFDDSHRGLSKISTTVKQHFIGTLLTLKQYTPKPMDLSKMPNALVFWAKSGILESTSQEHNEIIKDENINKTMGWLLYPRKDYGPGGWENLIPNIECTIIPGNHFTIMRQPQVNVLAKKIEQAVTKFSNMY